MWTIFFDFYGPILPNIKEYLRSCYEHLLSIQTIPGKSPTYYYKQVDSLKLAQAISTIEAVLKDGLDKNIITKEEYLAMDPTDGNPARLYCNFKIHKKHNLNQAPPPRPIISGSGSILENIGKYVEFHINHIASEHESFLQDTPHFLRSIEEINEGPKLSSNSMLVVIDVTGAYLNIPHNDGIQALEEALKERKKQIIPSDFLSKLMELILKNNIFEFNEDLYKQLIGAAMGTPPAPSYANIYMAKRIDGAIREAAIKYGTQGKSALQMLKRFLDDIFQIFSGTTKQLHSFFEEINQIHPTLKFTMSHTTPISEMEQDRCPCEPLKSVPFLDTSCSIENG